jgi:copper chaperone CopZ
MRAFLAMMVLGGAVAFLGASQGAGGVKVEVKGPHICCKQCISVVGKILGKVDGVADVKADAATKMVTFTAKDDAAAKAGVKALIDGGFYGAATADSKEMKFTLPAGKKGDKVDVLKVKDVHVCCGQCEKAIKAIFSDGKVSFEGKGPQKTVSVESKGLEAASVLETLRKTGFNGSIVEK